MMTWCPDGRVGFPEGGALKMAIGREGSSPIAHTGIESVDPLDPQAR